MRNRSVYPMLRRRSRSKSFTPVCTGGSPFSWSSWFSASDGGTEPPRAAMARSISSRLRISLSYRAGEISPVRSPRSVSRRSALSCRNSSRYSAREVIIR